MFSRNAEMILISLCDTAHGRERMTQIDRRRFLSVAGGATLLSAAGQECPAYAEGARGRGAAAQSGQLNFIVILIDDLGWTDLACFGSDLYQTPHLDRLAAEGVRFTNAYAACTVCSPTRAAVMTGKYPARLHVTDWIPGHKRPHAQLAIPEWTEYLPLAEVTIAEALKAAGYATCHIGKWHLGYEDHWPDKQGFDLNIGGDHRGQPPSYFSPYGIPTLPDGPEGEFLTDREAAEACRFIEENAERPFGSAQGRPFFLYLAHYAVHTPLQAKQELVEAYQPRITPQHRHQNATYAAMVQSVDESTGRIMATLDELGIAERTVVFFSSDNGGLLGHATDNAPLRAGKGSAYEGGVRVPLIVRGPGVQSGGECAEPVQSIDFFPTVLDMAGMERDPKENQDVDGKSMVPLLRGPEAELPRNALYWHYPHYHPGGAAPHGAVRARDWKLIEFYEDMHVELYQLVEDIGETADLAEKEPQKAGELRRLLHQWREDVGAQMPTPNPDYDPEKDEW